MYPMKGGDKVMSLRNLFGCGENGGCTWLLFFIILILLSDNKDRGGCGC